MFRPRRVSSVSLLPHLWLIAHHHSTGTAVVPTKETAYGINSNRVARHIAFETPRPTTRRWRHEYGDANGARRSCASAIAISGILASHIYCKSAPGTGIVWLWCGLVDSHSTPQIFLSETQPTGIFRCGLPRIYLCPTLAKTRLRI